MRYAPTLVRLKSGLDWEDGWVSFSLTSGRMRYAPTLVWLKFGLDWGMGELRFRPHQGVCDTPLHLFEVV